LKDLSGKRGKGTRRQFLPGERGEGITSGIGGASQTQEVKKSHFHFLKEKKDGVLDSFMQKRKTSKKPLPA